MSAKAALTEATAVKTAAEAQVVRIEATPADIVLPIPVAGRAEYRAGAVERGGRRRRAGRMILDLSDAYMTVFLPTNEAGAGAAVHPDRAREVGDGLKAIPSKNGQRAAGKLIRVNERELVATNMIPKRSERYASELVRTNVRLSSRLVKSKESP